MGRLMSLPATVAQRDTIEQRATIEQKANIKQLATVAQRQADISRANSQTKLGGLAWLSEAEPL